MNLHEVAKQFGLASQTVHAYEEAGLLRTQVNCEEYREDDIARLGLIDTLVKAGFELQEIKRYVTVSTQEQIRMLRSQRKKLLGDIHVKQQTLDSIDYIIWEKGKQGGS